MLQVQLCPINSSTISIWFLVELLWRSCCPRLRPFRLRPKHLIYLVAHHFSEDIVLNEDVASSQDLRRFTEARFLQVGQELIVEGYLDEVRAVIVLFFHLVRHLTACLADVINTSTISLDFRRCIILGVVIASEEHIDLVPYREEEEQNLLCVIIRVCIRAEFTGTTLDFNDVVILVNLGLPAVLQSLLCIMLMQVSLPRFDLEVRIKTIQQVAN